MSRFTKLDTQVGLWFTSVFSPVTWVWGIWKLRCMWNTLGLQCLWDPPRGSGGSHNNPKEDEMSWQGLFRAQGWHRTCGPGVKFHTSLLCVSLCFIQAQFWARDPVCPANQYATSNWCLIGTESLSCQMAASFGPQHTTGQ